MKTVVAMDSDGHFMVANLENREGVLALIKNIFDGDYLTNMLDNDELEIPIKDDLGDYCCQKWPEFVEQFVQRSILEIVTVDAIDTHGCKCIES